MQAEVVEARAQSTGGEGGEEIQTEEPTDMKEELCKVTNDSEVQTTGHKQRYSCISDHIFIGFSDLIGVTPIHLSRKNYGTTTTSDHTRQE
jgi:hypothetical protein